MLLTLAIQRDRAIPFLLADSPAPADVSVLVKQYVQTMETGSMRANLDPF